LNKCSVASLECIFIKLTSEQMACWVVELIELQPVLIC
jgi:hypothetical protein